MLASTGAAGLVRLRALGGCAPWPAGRAAGRFVAPRDVIADDVLLMLQDLVDKKVLRQ